MGEHQNLVLTVHDFRLVPEGTERLALSADRRSSRNPEYSTPPVLELETRNALEIHDISSHQRGADGKRYGGDGKIVGPQTKLLRP